MCPCCPDGLWPQGEVFYLDESVNDGYTAKTTSSLPLGVSFPVLATGRSADRLQLQALDRVRVRGLVLAEGVRIHPALDGC